MTTDNEGWIKQKGKKMPVDPSEKVECETPNDTDCGNAHMYDWSIVRWYRLLVPKHELDSAQQRIAELEAENQRLRQALQEIKSAAELPQKAYDRNGPSFTSPAGLEYEFTSDFLAKCNELSEIARKALEASQ